MSENPHIRLICATRMNQTDFLAKSALGRSLSLCPWPDVELRLFVENKAGLPTVYNRALAEALLKPAILVFIHDDVCLSDYFWPNQVRAGLQAFDIIGLAGNRRRVDNQPAWAFIDSKLSWDQRENLSGTVGHGKGFVPSQVSVYGPSGQEVKLLDGVLVAAHSETLQKAGVRFDESFDFHFYDLDFCRQAEAKQLRMGTWPIAIIHESGGNFGSESWRRGYAKYLAKWGK